MKKKVKDLQYGDVFLANAVDVFEFMYVGAGRYFFTNDPQAGMKRFKPENNEIEFEVIGHYVYQSYQG